MLIDSRFPNARPLKREHQLGRLTWHVGREIEYAPHATLTAFRAPLLSTHRLLIQTCKSMHTVVAPELLEVDVIRKGRVAKSWAFGGKISVALTMKVA